MLHKSTANRTPGLTAAAMGTVTGTVTPTVMFTIAALLKPTMTGTVTAMVIPLATGTAKPTAILEATTRYAATVKPSITSGVTPGVGEGIYLNQDNILIVKPISLTLPLIPPLVIANMAYGE